MFLEIGHYPTAVAVGNLNNSRRMCLGNNAKGIKIEVVLPSVFQSHP